MVSLNARLPWDNDIVLVGLPVDLHIESFSGTVQRYARGQELVEIGVGQAGFGCCPVLSVYY